LIEEADCSACFVVDSDILPDFAYLVVVPGINVGLNIWLCHQSLVYYYSV
jgi:hypothetical protein